jgi:predicted phage terminase large subunit-like protein
MLTKEEYFAVLRGDPFAFNERCFRQFVPDYKPNWHHDVITDRLSKCEAGQIRRLIINVPPRSGKSTQVSINFVARILGNNPAAQIICVTYSQDLSNCQARLCRQLMQSDFYRRTYPNTRISDDRNSVEEFVTTKNGYRLATSVGGQLTGRGAEYIIIDDSLKPGDSFSEARRNYVNEWFISTLLSRLNNKLTGRIIIVMQRLHEDDLVGHVLGLDDWTILRFPAIAEEDESYQVEYPIPGVKGGSMILGRKKGEALQPEREPLAFYESLRKQIGESHFQSQYQQNPAPSSGGLIDIRWFNRYSLHELPDRFDIVILSVDTAMKASEFNDFNVMLTLGVKDGRIYLLHVLRKRMGYPELKKTLIEQTEIHHATHVLVEDRGSGTPLIQECTAEGFAKIIAINPVGEKEVRAEAGTSLMEAGRVYIPHEAPWLDEFLHELSVFPNGKYDDQVDGLSQAMQWLKERLLKPEPYVVNFWRMQIAEDNAKRWGKRI